ncbi:MAG TPA: dTDP-4-dehydrorhamnose reductase [Gemmatimonadales bacterium]|nr:dTDP-4-dehydrorhamnose reductase [Gemmatimonadales bacterium]
MSPRRTPTALVTGASGQVGRALRATAPPAWRLVGCDHAALDVTHPESVAAALDRERPALVINAAAYTAVDAAEREADRAEAVNSAGAALVAEEARRIGARVIHLSTDFVFDGAQGRPYEPGDRPNPFSVYGRTKLAGEREVLRISSGEALVVRTSWIYAAEGRNFVLTMLRLMRERPSVGVVCDQVGTPTWARSVAEAIWAAAARPEVRGILHWSDAGAATWYDFAVAIQEEALAAGLLDRAVPVQPLRTDEYPAPARRPPYSVLDKSAAYAALGVRPTHWREHLRRMLREVAAA